MAGHRKKAQSLNNNNESSYGDESNKFDAELHTFASHVCIN